MHVVEQISYETVKYKAWFIHKETNLFKISRLIKS